jgi:hypothetical protein
MKIEKTVHQLTKGHMPTRIFKILPVPTEIELNPGAAPPIARYLAILPSPAFEYTGDVNIKITRNTAVSIPENKAFFFIALPTQISGNCSLYVYLLEQHPHHPWFG